MLRRDEYDASRVAFETAGLIYVERTPRNPSCGREDHMSNCRGWHFVMDQGPHVMVTMCKF